MRCIRTQDAVGHVLCHDITVIVKDVKKGVAFKKGHIVREEDIPELLKLEYEVARVIGDVFIAPMMRGKTLPEILNSNQPIAAAHRYAHEEIVVAREDFGIYRHYECADCYGLPNIGMKICAYEAGTAAGCFAKPLGRPVEVIETKCCANGDPYCEFEIHVG